LAANAEKRRRYRARAVRAGQNPGERRSTALDGSCKNVIRKGNFRMQYHISGKMKNLKPSAIREIFKYAGDPAVISLAGGNPAPETLPAEDVRRLMNDALTQDPMTALLYNQSEGYSPLRQALRDYLGGGLVKESDDVIVLSGAQQCMDLACKVLCDEGDVVLCESPSFIGSLNCFRSHGVRLVGVPMEQDGIVIDELEKAIIQNRNARMLYLIPNFQNPTGITMSAEKRKAVYALAKRHGLVIVEDNPYGDLRFSGEDIPSIKALDDDGVVIYAGTFSKILSSGIRVGYMVVSKELMGKIVVAKQCADVHSSMPAQMLCHRFLTQRDVLAHIEKNKAVYAHKCNLMLDEMDASFPKEVTYTRPCGGLFIWATMPARIDSNEFATRLVRDSKVCVVPGSAFVVGDGALASSFRLNFSASSDEQIKKGIAACAALLKEMLG